MVTDLDTIVSLAKRRGFVFPSSEIYGGMGGIYDYGPTGVLLANNLKNVWWKQMVKRRPDIVGLDASIFMNPKVWHASGHVGGFADPLVECVSCHTRTRADHLLGEAGIESDEKMSADELGALFREHAKRVKCPACGKSDFGDVKFFNLLVHSNLGNFTGDGEPAYLRGETCQGIYVNFKNVLDSTRMKIPFGIAQIGKAFRNEITPRQFLFRTREFEQMEMQYFTAPGKEMEEFERLKRYRLEALREIGIRDENVRLTKHKRLIFYAKEAFDIEYNYPFGWKELEGIHARGDYDLSAHAKGSGADLAYFDEESRERFIPHIVESSIGVGRLFLAVLCDAYHEEEVKGEKRVVLKFKPSIAPIQIAILPLSKRADLTIPAREILDSLKDRFFCQYDETQSIGRRYRRQDELGTPYCVTFDFESIGDTAVTVSDRDTMEQERVKIDELPAYFSDKLSG